MSWPATARYSEESAPQGLGFAQDLMNTAGGGKHRTTDLLADDVDAEAWLNQSLARWSEITGTPTAKIELSRQDWEELRAFRDDLRRYVKHAPNEMLPPMHTAAVAVQLGADGQLHLEARGIGWRRVAALALIEAFQAQQTGTWQRLKMCRNDRCGSIFFDRSRNNCGVWHSVKVCGNAANLRAYRARRRTQNVS